MRRKGKGVPGKRNAIWPPHAGLHGVPVAELTREMAAVLLKRLLMVGDIARVGKKLPAFALTTSSGVMPLPSS